MDEYVRTSDHGGRRSHSLTGEARLEGLAEGVMQGKDAVAAGTIRQGSVRKVMLWVARRDANSSMALRLNRYCKRTRVHEPHPAWRGRLPKTWLKSAVTRWKN